MSTWTQYVNQSVANGDTGATIVWPVKFLSVPIAADFWLVLPNSSAAPISAAASAVTTSGCTVTFSAATAQAGYLLQGFATVQQTSPQTSGCGCTPSTAPTCVSRPLTQGDTIPIGSGIDTIAINFPVQFAGIPAVTAMVIKADADHSNITVVGYTITPNGFIASLAAPTDDSTYQLSYVATFTP